MTHLATKKGEKRWHNSKHASKGGNKERKEEKELIFIFTQPYALLLTAKRQTIDVDNPLRVVVRAFCTLKSWLTVEIAENWLCMSIKWGQNLIFHFVVHGSLSSDTKQSIIGGFKVSALLQQWVINFWIISMKHKRLKLWTWQWKLFIDKISHALVAFIKFQHLQTSIKCVKNEDNFCVWRVERKKSSEKCKQKFV